MSYHCEGKSLKEGKIWEDLLSRNIKVSFDVKPEKDELILNRQNQVQPARGENRVEKYKDKHTNF